MTPLTIAADRRRVFTSAALHKRLADHAQLASASLQQAAILLVLGLVWALAHAMRWRGKPPF
jgi:hypothetical protein